MPVTTSDLPSNIIGDIQMTWVGRLIRRLNIDELPQLINILRGEMSVVGPRPSLVTEKELVATRREKNVLRVHPGLTGLAQINSFNGMHLEEKVSFDQRYCENMSFMSDVRIIISTVLYMFKSPPKY
jgi:O-antigen biosynthesis protein WbqP